MYTIGLTILTMAPRSSWVHQQQIKKDNRYLVRIISRKKRDENMIGPAVSETTTIFVSTAVDALSVEPSTNRSRF